MKIKESYLFDDNDEPVAYYWKDDVEAAIKEAIEKVKGLDNVESGHYGIFYAEEVIEILEGIIK